MNRERKYASASFFLSTVAFFLALHPKSLLMYFAAGPEERVARWYSYFSLMPLGYGNLGPLIAWSGALMAAVCSVILILSGRNKLWKWIRRFAAASVMGSTIILMLSGNLTMFGIGILVLMIGTVAVAHPRDQK